MGVRSLLWVLNEQRQIISRITLEHRQIVECTLNFVLPQKSTCGIVGFYTKTSCSFMTYCLVVRYRFLYAIGNTPAENLLEDYDFKQTTIDHLLIGAGAC